MVAMGRGGGKTPERIVQLISGEVAKIGQNATSRAIGIPLFSLQKYLKGIAEPTQATFEKLAGYFETTVSWLRGEDPIDLVEKISPDEMLRFCIKSGFAGGEKEVIDELVCRGFEESTASEFLQIIKKSFSPELVAKNWNVSCEDEIIKPIIEKIYSCMIMEKEVSLEWFEEAMIATGKQINDETIKPLLNQILDFSTQDIISIAAIINQFSINDKFKKDVKQLLNNSVAHSK